MNLKDLQTELKRPLDEKIEGSLQIIREALAKGKAAVSYSGGKDSEVVNYHPTSRVAS